MTNTCPGGPNAHIDRKQWTQGRRKDGTLTYRCRHCHKFIGQTPPVKDAK